MLSKSSFLLVLGGSVATLIVILWLSDDHEFVLLEQEHEARASYSENAEDMHTPDGVDSYDSIDEGRASAPLSGPGEPFAASARDVGNSVPDIERSRPIRQAQLAQQEALQIAESIQLARRQIDRKRLVEAGFTYDRVEWIFQRADELRDEFLRVTDGEPLEDGSPLALMDPDARLRVELGDEEYERYLEALGRTRAVQLNFTQ